MINSDADTTVTVNGDTVAVNQLVAIAESLQLERPHLFAFLKSFHSSHEEMTQLFRQMISADYDHHAADALARASKENPAAQQQQNPPKEEDVEVVSEDGVVLVNLPVPSATRSSSLQESLELAERLEAEELAQEQEQVRLLAEKLACEDRRQAELFYCNICMDDEASIHGAITLDCDHRFCEECLSGFICSKIDCNEISEQELKCPRPDCCYCISHPTIRGLTEGLEKPDIYEKFLSFATDKYLQETIEAGAALRCPNETCNYVFQWRPDGSSVAFKCDKCSSEYCLNCSLVEGDAAGIGPGHAPLSCAEQKEKMERDAETRRKFEEWQQLNERAAELFEKMVTSSGWKRK